MTNLGYLGSYLTYFLKKIGVLILVVCSLFLI